MLASSAARAKPKSVILTCSERLVQQDVARLDVAVDQALRMGGGQAAGNLPADAQHLRHRQRPARVEFLL